MKIVRLTTAGVLVISALLMLFTPALADVRATYGFCNITKNSIVDEAIGEAQLEVDVEDVAGNPNVVVFTFRNKGPAAASIADIYFDDGSLLYLDTITNGPGTSFSRDAVPEELPGANNANPPFITTAGFSADSDNPVAPNGVGPGEWVSILFTLQDALTYTNVIADLTSGELRIGIHVQGFADGESEGFVNCERTAITLASFAAQAAGSTVTLEWATGTEINNAGFNLYRASAVDGVRTKVNPYLLAATGEGASGASYKYLDAPGYGTFFYWLEDVEFTGATALHGPVSVTVVSPIRRPAYRPVLPAGQ